MSDETLRLDVQITVLECDLAHELIWAGTESGGIYALQCPEVKRYSCFRCGTSCSARTASCMKQQSFVANVKAHICGAAGPTMRALTTCWPQQMAARSPCQLRTSGSTALEECCEPALPQTRSEREHHFDHQASVRMRCSACKIMECHYRMPPCWHARSSRGPGTGL